MPCNECVNSKNKKQNLALPLIKAVERGHTRCLEAMVQRGDDVNGKDDNGDSVLIHATSKGKLESIRILVQAGVNVNAVSGIGSTALMFAAGKGYVNCMKYLIRNGADVKACDYHEGTALNYVAVHGRLIQAALVLLRALSPINVYDVGGQNAVENHLANNTCVNKKLLKLLIVAGEKIGDSYSFRGPLAGPIVVRLPIPEYLREQNSKICIMQMCRQVIREYLIKINPNQHLFHRIPQIGLPTVLSDYLLYGLSIEKKTGDDTEEETDDEDDDDDFFDWREERNEDDDDSDYEPENDHDQEEENVKREEEWDNKSESDDHGDNHSHSRNYYHKDQDNDSFDENEDVEPEDPNDEDYDP